MTARKFVIMGVSGCGKSTVGTAIATQIGAVFLDADDLHPAANIEKMSSGVALTDADREPWLYVVGTALADQMGDVVMACSALKRSYRDIIRDAAGGPVTFLFLSGARCVIQQRLQSRTNHFMSPDLLNSQFDALEPMAVDENVIEVDIDQPLDDVVQCFVEQIGA